MATRHGDVVDARRLLVPDRTKTAPSAAARPHPKCERGAGGFEHGSGYPAGEYLLCCTAEADRYEYTTQKDVMARPQRNQYKDCTNTSWLH